MPKKRGRPVGSKSRKYDEVPVMISRCPNCDSTDRTNYDGQDVLRLPRAYESPLDGKPYNVIVKRACQCKKCGYWRRDKSYELDEVAASNPN